MRGRPRVFIKHELPSGVVGVCVAIIADYNRRSREIAKGTLSESLLLSYKKYNDIVEQALECVEDDMRSELISDIESGRGYCHSRLACTCNKKTYYRRKRQIIYVIAKELGLAE